MGAQRIPAPITVEEYERIPNPPGGHYELHHGELVFVTYPVRRHRDLQRRLRELLTEIYRPNGFVIDTEYPYRALPENEVWGADVACVKTERHFADEKWLVGSPELVAEVKSPSKTKAELHDKVMTTLAGAGAVEFWIVDPDSQTITVYSKTGMTVRRAGESVSVPVVDGCIRVEDVFAVL